MGRLQTVLRATLLQQGFDLAAMVISFVAIPLYLVYLGAERYGLLLTAQAWAGYLSFGNSGISQSTMILVSHASGRGDSAELSRIVRTSLALAAVAATAVLLLSLGTVQVLRAGAVARQLKMTHPEAPGLLFAVGLQVMNALVFSTFYDLLIGLQRVREASAFQGVQRVAGQIVAIGVVVKGGSVGQVVGATVFTSMLVGATCALRTWRTQPQAFMHAGVTWDQVRLQLRTGAKSLGLQIGATLGGTAPTLAIATIAGPAVVPLFAVPARLLSLGTGMVASFSALLQPSFGEAFTRGDIAWIRSTLIEVWEKTLLVMAVAAALLIALGGAFIAIWTAGKLHVSPLMLASVAAAGAITTSLAPIRYLLSGINRHKWAALIEISNGVLSMLLAFAAARALSAEWVGLGVATAVAFTSGWLLPAQARQHLGLDKLLPGSGRLLAIALCALSVYASSRLILAAGQRIAPGHSWATLLLSVGVAAVVCAAGMVWLKLIVWRELYQRFRAQGS